MGRKNRCQNQPRAHEIRTQSIRLSSMAFTFVGVLLLGLVSGLHVVYGRGQPLNAAEPKPFGMEPASVAQVGQSGDLPPLSTQGKPIEGWHDMANMPKDVAGQPLPKDQPQPDVVVIPANHSLESVGRKDIVSLSYIVVNDGDRDLVIENVVTSCGCTTATLSNNIVPPGYRADLAVRFDAGYHTVDPGQEVVRVMWLMTNDPDTPVAAARLTAVIQ